MKIFAKIICGVVVVTLMSIAAFTQARPPEIVAPTAENPLLGHWVESKRLLCDYYRENGGGNDETYPSVREFMLSADGSFSVTEKPFETYQDYWGIYSLNLKNGKIDFHVGGGNAPPSWKTASANFKLAGGRLVIEGVRFIDNGPPCSRSSVFRRFGDSSKDTKAVLTSEFGILNPCAIKAKIDDFLNGLKADPHSSGEIVIYRSRSHFGFAYRARGILLEHLATLHVDPSKVKITVGPVRNASSVQLWRIPPTASRPVLLDSVLDDPLGGPQTPYVYAVDPIKGPPTCDGPTYDFADFAALLTSDEILRAKITISAFTPAKFRRRKGQIASALGRAGIEQGRMSFVYKRASANKESVALWVVGTPIES